MKHPEWKFFTAQEMRNRGATYKQISATVRVPESTIRSWWSHRRPRTVTRRVVPPGAEESSMGRDVLARNDNRLFVPSHPIPFSSVSIMQKHSDDVVREAIKLRATGMPIRKMSTHMGIPYQTIKEWFYSRGRATRIMNETQTQASDHDNPTVPGVQADPAGQAAN